jgi:hypothetical protein
MRFQNPKIAQILEIHLGWIAARAMDFDELADGLDRERMDITKTLTAEEKDELYDEIEKIYSTCDIRH